MRRHTIKLLTIAAVALTAATTARAQNPGGSFSVMTLNVDGLPGKLLFFDVNSEGPQELGSIAISGYLARKDCDIVAMQENFNYRWEIWSHLVFDYQHDEWSGGIFTGQTEKLDYIHPQNIKLPCDGLNMVWKREFEATKYERVAWEKNFGKFSHDFDDIITKGFRRHEITLKDGLRLVVYNMHMDSSSERDNQLGNDAKDREARLSQWIQLREHIMSRLDDRPVVVMGDMNSYYYRDPVKREFIDAIQTTGRATVSDVWVEKELGGNYPSIGSEPLVEEMLDKVLYINPVNARTIIVPTNFEIDKAGYVNTDGSPLSDHYPLIVRFATAPAGISRISHAATSATPEEEWFSLQGSRQDDNSKGISVSRNGQKKINSGR